MTGKNSRPNPQAVLTSSRPSPTGGPPPGTGPCRHSPYRTGPRWNAFQSHSGRSGNAPNRQSWTCSTNGQNNAKASIFSSPSYSRSSSSWSVYPYYCDLYNRSSFESFGGNRCRPSPDLRYPGPSGHPHDERPKGRRQARRSPCDSSRCDIPARRNIPSHRFRSLRCRPPCGTRVSRSHSDSGRPGPREGRPDGWRSGSEGRSSRTTHLTRWSTDGGPRQDRAPCAWCAGTAPGRSSAFAPCDGHANRSSGRRSCHPRSASHRGTPVPGGRVCTSSRECHCK